MKDQQWANPDALKLGAFLKQTDDAIVDALTARIPKAYDSMKDRHDTADFAIRSAFKEGFESAISDLRSLSKTTDPVTDASAGSFTAM